MSEKVFKFIRNVGIERVARKTLDKLRINTMHDLVSFGKSYSGSGAIGKSFAEQICAKVLEASEAKLFVALPFEGLSETTLQKYLRRYGMRNIRDGQFDGFALPDGVGVTTHESFLRQLPDMLTMLDVIVKDPDYESVGDSTINNNTSTTNNTITYQIPDTTATNTPAASSATIHSTQVELERGVNGTICFTGALKSMTRSEASKRAEAAGMLVKSSVTRDLDYLVTNDPFSGSSKARKAASYGTQIMTEEEFLGFLNTIG